MISRKPGLLGSFNGMWSFINLTGIGTFPLLLILSCSEEEKPTTLVQDLGVAYIHRTPEIEFVTDADQPSIEGWPADGQEVFWGAIVVNNSNHEHRNVAYQWQIDGAVMEEGSFDILGLDQKTLAIRQLWSFERKTIKLAINPDKVISEQTYTNNALEVHTNDLSIGFYAERSFVSYFHQNSAYRSDGVFSFSDWAQARVTDLNKMLADAAVYDQFRIDRITVVEDGALPLNKTALTLADPIGGYPRAESIPNLDDRAVDIQWGFRRILLVALTTGTGSPSPQTYCYMNCYTHDT